MELSRGSPLLESLEIAENRHGLSSQSPSDSLAASNDHLDPWQLAASQRLLATLEFLDQLQSRHQAQLKALDLERQNLEERNRWLSGELERVRKEAERSRQSWEALSERLLPGVVDQPPTRASIVLSRPLKDEGMTFGSPSTGSTTAERMMSNEEAIYQSPVVDDQIPPGLPGALDDVCRHATALSRALATLDWRGPKVGHQTHGRLPIDGIPCPHTERDLDDQLEALEIDFGDHEQLLDSVCSNDRLRQQSRELADAQQMAEQERKQRMLYESMLEDAHRTLQRMLDLSASTWHVPAPGKVQL